MDYSPVRNETPHSTLTKRNNTQADDGGRSYGRLHRLDHQYFKRIELSQEEMVPQQDMNRSSEIADPQSMHYELSCPKRCRVFFRRKYVFDRCLGGMLLVASSPLILGLYVLVRMTSRGSGFYRQKRVGLHGETFEIIKLRSMVMDAEKPGVPEWAAKNDPRVTRVGRFLRKLHLDELPQLLNVFRGEMSLVGPRPERPKICDDLAGEIEGYYQRNVVKPGVTGLAQINLPPDETLEDVRRKQILDLHYIENAGLWLDSRMILATALRLVGVKGDIVMRLMRLRRRHLVDSAAKVQETDCMLPQGVVTPRPAVLTRDNLEPVMAYASAIHSAETLSGVNSSIRPR